MVNTDSSVDPVEVKANVPAVAGEASVVPVKDAVSRMTRMNNDTVTTISSNLAMIYLFQAISLFTNNCIFHQQYHRLFCVGKFWPLRPLKDFKVCSSLNAMF